MSGFRVHTGPGAGELETLERLAPTNPFATAAHAAAQRTLGMQPLVLLAEEADGRAVGALALLRRGRLTRTLHLPSLPGEAGESFWRGLADYRRRARVDVLELRSYGSSAAVIPVLGGRERRAPRTEYVWSLDGAEWEQAIGTNHRRNARRATERGFVVTRTSEVRALDDHLALVRASAERRADRGGTREELLDANECRALLASGAGVCVRCADAAGVVHSSLLVLLAREGAYYHSAGTSPEGMSAGASQLLVREVARQLRDDGVRLFNLGGASSESAGLHRFKAGFGATAVSLEEADIRFGLGVAARGMAVLRRLRARAGEVEVGGGAPA